jgi:hypothetical protein
MKDLDRLLRWEEAGGTWQVLARRRGSVTVAMCRCDGGEEVDRFVSDDADLLAHLGDRERSDPAP